MATATATDQRAAVGTDNRHPREGGETDRLDQAGEALVPLAHRQTQPREIGDVRDT